MSDAIIGVIIGGLLTGSITIFGMYMQHKKWKIEQKVKRLQSKKEEYLKIYDEILPKLKKAVHEGSHDTDMISSLKIYFPEHIFQKLADIVRKKTTTDIKDTDLKQEFINISSAIKTLTVDIDKEIDELLK